MSGRTPGFCDGRVSFARRHGHVYELTKVVYKVRGIKSLRPVADDHRVKILFSTLELDHCVADGCDSLFMKEDPRSTPLQGRFPSRCDRLQSTPFSVGDHRSSAGLRLHRDHSKILLGRKQQCPAAGVFAPEHFVVYPPEELDRRACESTQVALLRPNPDDSQ